MTRRDYELIARAIRTTDIEEGLSWRTVQWVLAEHMANYLLSDNPDRFDPDRFIAAATQEVPDA